MSTMIPRDVLEKIDNKQSMVSFGVNKQLRATAMELTEWLPAHAPLYVRLNTLRLGYTESTFPRCHCGQPVKWARATNQFSKYCSGKCVSISQTHNSPPVSDLIEDRINRRLSKDTIALKYNTSPGVVDRWLEEAGISKIRYNEANPIVRAKLRDYDLMFDLHKIQRMTVEQIALEIGSSGAVVSTSLRDLGIDANAPNSYDRNHGTSQECQQVIDFVVSMGFNVKTNDRQILGGREIDIVLEDQKFCIEYNGLYHHSYRPWLDSEAQQKGPKYHLSKLEGCQKKGYQLLHIFSDDWTDPVKKEIIKSMIKSRLKLNTRTAARKLIISTVDNAERKLFFNSNHLQGDTIASLCTGLYDIQGNLCAAMTFNKSRFSKKHDWELVRYASVKGVNVVGGFTKLLSHFKKHNSGTIVTYADRCYSNGDVYRNNGFQEIRVNAPSFYYVDPDCTRKYTRGNFMKKKIGPLDPRPEWEIMQDRGYLRIWNCGTITFELV